MNKDIYIIQQYPDPDHFNALFRYAKDYGYNIKAYIPLQKRRIIKDFLLNLKKGIGVIKSVQILFYYFNNLKKINCIENSILIVGIAPYDYLLNKYEKLIKKNSCIFFCSWQYWGEEEEFPRGSRSNREKFIEILKNDFVGACCVSKKTASFISTVIKNYGIVNHSINYDEYKKKITFARNKRYLYLGRYEEIKNIDYILHYASKNPNIQFDFAGQGSLEDKINEYSNQYTNIKNMGFLSKDVLKQILCSYDYLILPSKMEPFGIVLLESLAAGTPCIVSDAIGPSEIITNSYNGFVFNKESEDEFIKVMDSSLSISEEKYLRLVENALESSKKYDVQAIIKEWIRVFNNIDS